MYLKHIKTAIKILPFLLAAICLNVFITGNYNPDTNNSGYVVYNTGTFTNKGHIDANVAAYQAVRNGNGSFVNAEGATINYNRSTALDGGASGALQTMVRTERNIRYLRIMDRLTIISRSIVPVVY